MANNNNLDGFERQLKEHLEHYEVPFNSADWAQMDRALSSGVRAWGHGRALVAGLLLAGGLLIGGTAYFLGRDSSTQALPVPHDAPATGMVGEPAGTAQPPATADGMAATTAVPAGSEAAGGTTAAPSSPHAAQPSTSSGTVKTPHPAAAKPAQVAPPAALPTTPPAGKPEAPAAATAFRASAKEACPGSPVAFKVEHMAEDGIYLWNFGDGSFSNKANPEHIFTKPGNYQVMLSLSSSGMGTIRNKPSSDMIVVHEAPLAGFNIVKMDHAGLVPSVYFDSRAMGAASYEWDLGDGTTSTAPNPDHVYRKKGVYQVVQTVVNATGCTDRKMKEVRIEQDFDLGAAKSFTPALGGKEGCFMPQALLELKAKFQFAVYDPAGMLVYSTNEANRPWLGKANNQGAVLAPANYAWVADVETGHGTETFTGTVQLVR